MDSVKTANVLSAALEPWPIAPEDVLAGEPRASGLSLHDGDGSGTGVWECTPGSFRWAYETNQSMCLLAGEAEIQIEGGARLTLKAGDAAFFPAGTHAVWTVRSTVRKLYTLYR